MKTTSNVIPVWNCDLRLFLFCGRGARQSLFTANMGSLDSYSNSYSKRVMARDENLKNSMTGAAKKTQTIV